ncbi:tyrosine-protein phosphatase [Shouchella miscanthi]|uniref:tyrosine-protein phosphatase n=1 Tax=Shouchella miscanthi TaxID=2598861 RepID=UPI0011A80BA9|nr:CpsB/CapC family capsule biosynthesis tyrosine phosphatase [Shouchella miscanthi]
MIDIHSHILPGLDDGAKTIEDSIAIAEQAVSEGVTAMVATPHHQHPNFPLLDGSFLHDAVAELNEELNKQGIPLTVMVGQEIRLYGDVPSDLASGSSLSLANSKYVLVEFPSNDIPVYATRLFYELGSQGYIPIIAHPERNKVIMESPNKLYELIKNGALAQLTSSSLTGYFGKDIQTLSEQLIEANLVHVIASDVHNTSNRTLRMQEAYQVVEDRFGSQLLFEYKENARLIVENKHIYLEPPERVTKKRKKLFGLF